MRRSASIVAQPLDAAEAGRVMLLRLAAFHAVKPALAALEAASPQLKALHDNWIETSGPATQEALAELANLVYAIEDVAHAARELARRPP